MRPRLIQFAVWNDDEQGFWELFDSLEEAVEHAGEWRRVYRLDAVSLGKFRMANVVERVRQKKKRRRK